MKIVTYNIQFGKGKDDRFDLNRIVDEVSGADIIAMQEVERFCERSGNIDQAAEIAGLLGEYHWVYGAGIDINADVETDGVITHRRQQFGNMLLSKTPIIYSRNHLLAKYGSLGPISIQRSALECVLSLKHPLRVYSVHLTHLASETRLPQIDQLLDIHHNAVMEGPPLMGDMSDGYWPDPGLGVDAPRDAIFLGDFNFTPDSDEYDRMTGPESPYGGRMSNPDGFVDAWAAAGHDELEGSSAEVKGQPARLDYCFISTRLRNTIKSVRIDNDALGSDHQPVWIELDL